MSEKKIIGTEIGPEAKLDLKIVDGALVVSVAYSGADGYASIAAGLKPDAFIDKLKAAIPGTLDDMIFDALKGAMK